MRAKRRRGAARATRSGKRPHTEAPELQRRKRDPCLEWVTSAEKRSCRDRAVLGDVELLVGRGRRVTWTLRKSDGGTQVQRLRSFVERVVSVSVFRIRKRRVDGPQLVEVRDDEQLRAGDCLFVTA